MKWSLEPHFLTAEAGLTVHIYNLTLLDGTGLGGVVENLGLLWPAWDSSQDLICQTSKA